MRGIKIALLVILAAPTLWLFKFVVYDTWDAYMYSEARNIERCVVRTDEQAIDAAIGIIVRAGESFIKKDLAGRCESRLLDGSCLNPFPYASVAQFKADNPECCRVISDLPGDLPPSLRERIKSGVFPKTYPVELRYKEYSKGLNGERRSYVRTDLKAVDCLRRM
jgi:hypothetical protein